MAAMLNDFRLLSPKTDALLIALQVVGAVVFLLGTFMGLRAILTTLRGSRGTLAKLWAVLLAVALLVSLWVAIAFHVLAFGANY